MTLATAPPATDLIAILDDEIRLYTELLALGQRERAAVFGDTPSALGEITIEKERLVAQVARVETRRLRWIADWASRQGAGIDPNALTLSMLADRFSDVDRAALRGRRESLVTVLRDLADVNHRNGNLLGSALGVIGRQLDVFQRVGRASSYAPSGERARPTTLPTVALDLRA